MDILLDILVVISLLGLVGIFLACLFGMADMS